MADFQALLGDAAGARPSFVWRGKTYTLRLRTLGMLAAFEGFAKDHYKREMLADRDLCDAAEWKAKVADYEAKKRAGYFAFYGEYATDLRENQQAGQLQHLRLLLGDDAKGLADAQLLAMLLECQDDIEAGLSQYAAALEEAHRLSGYAKNAAGNWEGGDPKALGARLAGLGLD